MDRLKEIFDRQREYMLSLAPIYAKNGFEWHSEFPYPLDSIWGQEGFRLLAWRFTEEIFEAADALMHYGRCSKEFHEEMADAFHFLVELCIATGLSQSDIYWSALGLESLRGGDISDGLSYLFAIYESRERPVLWESNPFYQTLRWLAFSMMKFRQRPWRTDNRPTNIPEQGKTLAIAFRSFILTCRSYDMTADDLYTAYFAKSKINDQRTAAQKT